jgi:hypothetical protein
MTCSVFPLYDVPKTHTGKGMLVCLAIYPSVYFMSDATQQTSSDWGFLMQEFSKWGFPTQLLLPTETHVYFHVKCVEYLCSFNQNRNVYTGSPSIKFCKNLFRNSLVYACGQMVSQAESL